MVLVWGITGHSLNLPSFIPAKLSRHMVHGLLSIMFQKFYSLYDISAILEDPTHKLA